MYCAPFFCAHCVSSVLWFALFCMFCYGWNEIPPRCIKPKVAPGGSYSPWAKILKSKKIYLDRTQGRPPGGAITLQQKFRSQKLTSKMLHLSFGRFFFCHFDKKCSFCNFLHVFLWTSGYNFWNVNGLHFIIIWLFCCFFWFFILAFTSGFHQSLFPKLVFRGRCFIWGDYFLERLTAHHITPPRSH